jgi:hypothetical protein
LVPWPAVTPGSLILCRVVRLFLHADGRDVSSRLADDLIHLPTGLPTLAEVRRLDYLLSALPGK